MTRVPQSDRPIALDKFDPHTYVNDLRTSGEYKLAVPVANHDLAAGNAFTDQQYRLAVFRFGAEVGLAGGMSYPTELIDKLHTRHALRQFRDYYRGLGTYLRRFGLNLSRGMGVCCADCDETLLVLVVACERTLEVTSDIMRDIERELADMVAARERSVVQLPLIPPRPEEDHSCAECHRRPRRLIVDGVGYCNRCAEAKGVRAQGPIK